MTRTPKGGIARGNWKNWKTPTICESLTGGNCKTPTICESLSGGRRARRLLKTDWRPVIRGCLRSFSLRVPTPLCDEWRSVGLARFPAILEHALAI